MIESITKEDKEFIEEFKNLELLSLNLTKIKTLENFPIVPRLERVSIDRLTVRHSKTRLNVNAVL